MTQFYKHRAALAETGYKKLRLVWSSSLPIQSTFIPILSYGSDTLAFTDKQINRIDAYYLKFRRRLVDIRASFYSRISNHVVWRTAGYPNEPSYFRLSAQYNIVSEEFHTDSSLPLRHVVLNSAYRDRQKVKGRRRGRKKLYFIETTTQRYFPRIWSENPARGIFGPHAVYSAINKHLRRTSGHAPKRARRQRALAKFFLYQYLYLLLYQYYLYLILYMNTSLSTATLLLVYFLCIYLSLYLYIYTTISLYLSTLKPTSVSMSISIS